MILETKAVRSKSALLVRAAKARKTKSHRQQPDLVYYRPTLVPLTKLLQVLKKMIEFMNTEDKKGEPSWEKKNVTLGL